MQADVLESIRGALDEALADGQTRRQFARDLEPRLRALGWWGRQVVVGPDGGAEKVQLGSPHRLRTIFDSNMRSTFGAARQRQQVENSDSRPFWMYDARNDGRVRPSHAAMDGQVFRSDDPIWQTHYPPNGGCIPDFPVTRSHPPASWPSAANSSICRTYRKTAGEESRRRSPAANRWMRP